MGERVSPKGATPTRTMEAAQAAAEAAEGAEEGELLDKEVNERLCRRDRLPEDGCNGGARRAAL